MQAIRPTSSFNEQPVSAHAGTTRRWETAYTTVSWDYPPSPTTYCDALLARGASHSRFLRIAYLSTRPRSTTSASCPLASTNPRSANPSSHILKRRKPQWPKPPHYHASLLRSPLSHRKGLFRAVLPPSKAVDFFRRDIFVGATLGWEHDWTGSIDEDACASLRVAESVLGPYEAAAGFFGWHGLGLDLSLCAKGSWDGERCWNGGLDFRHDYAGRCRLSDLRSQVDEAAVEGGRARWVRATKELVGPPGSVLRSVVVDARSGKVTSPSHPTQRNVVDALPPSSISSGREEVRWDLDVGSSSLGPPRDSASDERMQLPLSNSMASVPGSSSFRPEHKLDSPPAWCHGPSPHRGTSPTPRLSPLRFLPPPPLQCGPSPLQFSPWFPGGRVASARGHGHWYGAQPIGAPSPTTRDSNVAKPPPPHSYIFATPATPTSVHPAHSFRYPAGPTLGRGERGLDHDFDKETETDHGYDSTTTTTDSDPPPHTPIGTTVSHCVEALRLHGDEMEAHGVEINEEHATSSVTIHLSDPTTPVKLPDRFSMSTSPSSLGSLDSDRESRESSKAVVVFPSLNETFCQGTVSPSTGTSAQTTPVSSSPSSSGRSSAWAGFCNQEGSKTKSESRGLEGSHCAVSGDGSANTQQKPCSPSLTSPGRGLRKDSQGFWEPVTPISPCSSSSSSSLSLSPSRCKMASEPVTGWFGEERGPVATRGEISESPESASPPSTLSVNSKSLSPGPHLVASAGSTRSSSSGSASSAAMIGGTYPSLPSPSSGSSLIPPNSTMSLPAFLATTTVKRKKISRTREIVDRLRSSSIDAGKGGVGLDSLGWLASPGAGGEAAGELGKASSGPDHAVGGQPSSSPPSPSGAGLIPMAESDSGKDDSRAPGSKSCDAGSSTSEGKSNGMTRDAVSGSETHFSHASPRTVTTTTNANVASFPILSVSQVSTYNTTVTQQNRSEGINGCEPIIATPPQSAGGPKINVTVATPSNSRSCGPQPVPSTPNGGTSPSVRPCHHALPSSSHPVMHPRPPLGPPPILAVSPYPHPMYVPFAQYHIPPPHQGQQGQGAWMAIYPGRPPHVPVHPLPVQTHVATITGVSGMRHVSW